MPLILPESRLQSEKRPILVVLHQVRSSAGRVGQHLLSRGFPLDIRRPVLGDPLPETMDGHAGAIIFGGPMSANDGEEHVLREIDWIKVPLAENRPYLGICLGAQMLVKTLGGQVHGHPEGLAEIGWYRIEATDAGRALLDWPDMVYHFHREGFDLPQGASLLARGDVYENQAFRYADNAWALQFHCELTRVMMHRWVVHGAHRFDLPNAQQGSEHLDGRLQHDAALRTFMTEFVDRIFFET